MTFKKNILVKASCRVDLVNAKRNLGIYQSKS